MPYKIGSPLLTDSQTLNVKLKITLMKKESNTNKANLINFHDSTIKGSGKKPLPILPIKWIHYRNDGAYASVNLAWLIEIYYFEN